MSRLERVKNLLEEKFSPSALDVSDFSDDHNVPKGSESHVKVRIVADAFDGKSLVQRHRLIYSALDQEMKQGLHALQLQVLSPTED